MLSQRFGGDPENFIPNYEAALRALRDEGQGLVDLARLRVAPRDVAQLDQQMFREWWAAAQPIEPILRRGFIEAIELGLRVRRPMEIVWVQLPADQFEIGIVESATQITVLIISPQHHDDRKPHEPDNTTLVYRRDGEIVVDR
jgi:hypothetical protein